MIITGVSLKNSRHTKIIAQENAEKAVEVREG